MVAHRVPRTRTGIRGSWRWAVVGIAVAVLVTLPSIVARRPVADPDVDLATLLQRVGRSGGVAHEGLFESRGGVRLPDLGRFDDQLGLFSGTTRVRVWYGAPDRWRADELGTGSERGWYREPGAIWRWQSGSREAIRSERPPPGSEAARLPRPLDLSPAELGPRLLAAAAADEIRRVEPRRVAGRAAVGIRIEPAAASAPPTTITSATLWVEARSGLVLRVELRTGGRVPILESAFLDLSVGPVDAGVITFDPDGADGIQVRRAPTLDAVEALGRASALASPERLAGLPRRSAAGSAVTTYGEGFGLVSLLVVPAGVLGRGGLPDPSTRPWGGEAVVVEARLVNVEVVVVAGLAHVLAGTVPVGELDRIAAELVAGGGVAG